MNFKDKLIYALLEAAGVDEESSAVTAEGKTTGKNEYDTMARIARWRALARQNPNAKPGEPGYTRKKYPNNVNPEFPDEHAAQHKRGVKVIRRIIRGGEMIRAHKATRRKLRGRVHGGERMNQVGTGVLRTYAPAIGGKTSDTENKEVMGYNDDGKFVYPEGRRKARIAARAGAEQGAPEARQKKQR